MHASRWTESTKDTKRYGTGAGQNIFQMGQDRCPCICVSQVCLYSKATLANSPCHRQSHASNQSKLSWSLAAADCHIVVASAKSACQTSNDSNGGVFLGDCVSNRTPQASVAMPTFKVKVTCAQDCAHLLRNQFSAS